MTTVWPAGHAPGPNDVAHGAVVTRFDRTERLVHWSSSLLILLAVATGLTLYVRPLSVLVSRRELMKTVHIVAGLTSLLPTIVAVGNQSLRRDIRRFMRWHDDDLRWFNRRLRRRSETGKFNAGQKLNAVLASSGMVVMALSGMVMWQFDLFPLEWRQGATFVHDWTSFALWFLIVGHVYKVLSTRDAFRGMWTGWAARADAEARPRWWAAIEPETKVGGDDR